MLYFLPLADKKQYGRMPIYNKSMEVEFMLLGNIGPKARTIFLNDLNHHELGRLSVLEDNLRQAYLLQLTDLDNIKVRLLGSQTRPIIYVSKFNYIVNGNAHKGNFVFRHGLTKVATVRLIVTTKGPTFKVNLLDEANAEAILLISALLTYRDLSGIKIKQPQKATAYQPSY